MTDPTTLAEALIACQADRVKELVQQKLDAGVTAVEIITECDRGMTELGDRFAAGECFIPELMIGGKIMKDVNDTLAPLLEEGFRLSEPVGTAVVGSVRGDMHNIGKDIVVMMLNGAGFEVIDMGVNVPPEDYVKAVAEHKPQILGLSVLLTTCWGSVIDTVSALIGAGLRDNLSVMVGGAASSERLSQEARCDFYGKTAMDGVTFAKNKLGIT
ncbi:MAG: cobalamin B12-binding domain-containing protein [Planctomycetota bacterium]|jgi:5-methyltetrahydrofolate--homocysteine methyltransferase